MKFHLLGAACTAIMTTAASAATLLVPAQHATIQDAIDAAASGDVIVVDPGPHQRARARFQDAAKFNHRFTLDSIPIRPMLNPCNRQSSISPVSGC